jgi:excisionase family DNA binding protein
MASEDPILQGAAPHTGLGRTRSAGTELQPLLTIEQVAELLAVSERTVRRLLGRGLPCIRVAGRVRFDPADVRRFLAARRS